MNVLRWVVARAAEVLSGRNANGVWPWSGGKAGSIHSIAAKYGIKGAIVAAVDVIGGLGRTMGLEIIRVPGATGYIDTNYEGKADAAVKAVKNGFDFVYVHLETTDEVSHARDLKIKLMALEDFDRRLIGHVIASLGDNVAYCVLPDHPVPLRLGRHTRTPVPVAVYQPGVPPDDVAVYDEVACLGGGLGHLSGSDLMDLLLSHDR